MRVLKIGGFKKKINNREVAPDAAFVIRCPFKTMGHQGMATFAVNKKNRLLLIQYAGNTGSSFRDIDTVVCKFFGKQGILGKDAIKVHEEDPLDYTYMAVFWFSTQYVFDRMFDAFKAMREKSKTQFMNGRYLKG